MKRALGLVVLAGLLLGSLGPPRAVAGEPDGWISPKKGYPREKGLGRMVVVTNHRSNTPFSKAVKRLVKHRDAKTLHLKNDDVVSVRKGLKKEGAE